MEKTKKNLSGDFLRNPPASIEAEQAVLSAIISNNKALERISEFLRAEHFTEIMHQKIYQACVDLIEKGHLADTITLKKYLENNGTLDMAGGINYLTQLASSAVSIVNVYDYAHLVYECALKRDLINLGTDIVNTAFGGDEDSDIPVKNQIEKAESELYNLAESGYTETGPVSLENTLKSSMQVIESAYRADGSISGISTGINTLDKQLGGLHPSDLLIIAGRPGMGKTAFALNLAFNVANEVFNHRGPEKLQGPVLFFSLEMSADQLASRILSFSAEVNGNSIRNGSISDEDFNKLVEFQRVLSDLPIYIDDTPDISVSAIRTRARRLKRKEGKLALIVIDYVQLLSPSGSKKSDNRVQEISEMTRGLKILAKELDVPVIALSQLSRLVEQRTDDKRPQLSDLRESGSIEQDADCVMFVYREAYYLDKELRKVLSDTKDGEMNQAYIDKQKKYDRVKNKAEIIIAKQRHGPTGTVDVAFIGEYFKFGNFYDGTTEG